MKKKISDFGAEERVLRILDIFHKAYSLRLQSKVNIESLKINSHFFIILFLFLSKKKFYNIKFIIFEMFLK